MKNKYNFFASLYNKNKLRLLATSLAGTILFSAAGCSNSFGKGSDDSSSLSVSETVENINFSRISNLGIYVVKSGDNFSSIADKLEIDLYDLLKFNKGIENINAIEPGLEIIYPVYNRDANSKDVIDNFDENAIFDVYEVQPGDNLLAIAEDLGCDYDDILKYNHNRIDNPDFIEVGFKVIYPVYEKNYSIQESKDEFNSDIILCEYIVQPGDTVYSISSNLKCNYIDIIKYNKLDDPNIIQPGDKISYPVSLSEVHRKLEELSSGCDIEYGNIFEIANKYQLDVVKLLKYNGREPYKYYLYDYEYDEEKDEEIAIPHTEWKVPKSTELYKLSNDYSETLEDGAIIGIDVSGHNGHIDWEKIKKQKIGFAIIKIRDFGADIDDSTVEENINMCIEHNIPFAVYYFSRAKDEDDAINEAQYMCEFVSKYDENIPIIIDIEKTSYDDDIYNKAVESYDDDKIQEAIDTAKTAVETIESYELKPIIYCNPCLRDVFIQDNELKNCTYWLTEGTTYHNILAINNFKLLESNDLVSNEVPIHQFSELCQIQGINGAVDLDYASKEFIDEYFYSSKVKSLN